LRLGLEFESPEGPLLFIVRHWGVLIFAIGASEKFVIATLIFFGPLQGTSMMTAIAIGYGIFAVVYVAYLTGL
jgi:hypothetical protein